ncbi:MAG: TetR/AcrR family transcriptional regulator [Pseudomonadota bacterium]|nr:TetR/AcrR family transcriptional regulator [Pseudomonadota bacterium]
MAKLEDVPQVGGLNDSPRGRVLRAAAYLFHLQGYSRTTVREIAQVVGIQSGSLFHHFKSKEDILCAVMTEAIIYNLGQMQRAVDQANSTYDQLKGLVIAELESINGDTGAAMAVLVHEWSVLPKARQAELLEMRQQYEDIWLAVLKKARQEGLIQHDPILWRRLIGGSISWSVTWYKPTGRLSLPQMAEELLGISIRSR